MGSSKSPLDSNEPVIDWQSEANHVLLNPRMLKHEADSLQEVADSLTNKFQLKGHLWLATSGSTAGSVAQTKLVALSKSAFLSSAKAVNEHLQVSSKDTWLQVLPRFHVGGLGIEVRALLSQSQVIQNFERWQAAQVSSLIEKENITLVSLVPAQVFDLVHAKIAAPKSVRAVVVGGGALTTRLYESARQLGWPLLPSYGMTETCSQIATASLETLQMDSAEMPLPMILSHAKCKTTPEGLLQVSATSLLSCYGQRQSDQSIVGWDPKVDGWFQSEDYVKLQQNRIQFLGRRNDFIKIGGEGSSMGRLREIFERTLLDVETSTSVHSKASFSFADQVALIDAPSARLGTEIHLVHTPQADERLLLQLKEKYNAEVLPFEKVRELKAVMHIPRSDLGKVLWAKLKRELYGD